MSDTYKKAGVNIDAGYEAVEKMKAYVDKTKRPEVIGGIGGFGALFELDWSKYNNPVLVAGTDGVGTKLKLAFLLEKHNTIGIDLVAMCVNDIVAQGAEPLFFLDYMALSKVEPDKVAGIVQGIAEGCLQAGCALIGGETAEMPGFYKSGEYDVAGFAVGIVEKDKIINGADIAAGDVLLGLASNGLHSNGFSLVRKLLTKDLESDSKIAAELLTPTRIYVKPLLQILDKYKVKGIAHITGGGFYENIPRILPSNCDAEVTFGSWPIHSIFTTLQKKGFITNKDMFNTFNMGIGMVLVVRKQDEKSIIGSLHSLGEQVYRIGEISEGSRKVQIRGGIL